MNFLAKTYFPKPDQNRMEFAGDLEKSRFLLFRNKPTNLLYLLEKRYIWMNTYLKDKSNIYELGCGAGFSKLFIKNKKLKLTDINKHEWVDLKVDALNLPFEKNSVDAFVCVNMMHHLANPYKFINQAVECLKPEGLLVIRDVNNSYALRFLLRLMRHEGWSYDVDVFSENSICNDPLDSWSANNAIPNLLFKSKRKFEETFKNTEIIHKEFSELLLLILSGGVVAKSRTVNLPRYLLNIVYILDKLLAKVSKLLFPIQINIVIKKTF